MTAVMDVAACRLVETDHVSETLLEPCCNISNELHCATSQKTKIFILVAVRT